MAAGRAGLGPPETCGGAIVKVPFDVRQVAGALGAEISGVDLGEPLPDETIGALTAALAEHQVLFFREQRLTPETQAAFAARFGPLQRHPAYGTADAAGTVTVLEHTAEKPSRIEEWHTDMTFRPDPPLGSLLYAKVVPAVGGDTLWASMTAAYDALSEGMKRYLDPLEAIHSFAHGFRHSLAAPDGARLEPAVAANPPVRHPVIRVHPQSGRKAIFVNPLFTTDIVGVPEPEGRAVLAFLWAHAVSPEFTVRFAWRAGSVAMWDNRATQHRPVNDHGLQHRMMHRVTIEGDRPRGPSA